ncbi:MAG: Ig-like domain-containing protein [Bacteroidota bacterium]
MSKKILLSVLGLFITFHLFSQTRLGLHVTQEELSIWRERANRGPYKTASDVQANSPGDWARILENANKFKGNSTTDSTSLKADRWTPWPGGGCHPESVPTVNTVTNQAVMLKDAAFVYLLKQDASYLPRVKAEILKYVRNPLLNFANRNRWCSVQADQSPGFTVSEFLTRILFAYDYVRIAGGFTAAEQTEVQNWAYNAGKWYSDNIDAYFQKRYENRLKGDYTLTDYSKTAETDNPKVLLYYGGPTVGFFAQGYNNRIGTVARFMGVAGVLTNNSALQANAKRVFFEWMRYGVFANGDIADLCRGFDRLSAEPENGLMYSFGLAQVMIDLADLFARKGDVSLYTYSTEEGYFGTQAVGNPKTLFKVITNLQNFLNGSLTKYASTVATTNTDFLINGIDPFEKPGEITYDTWFSMANQYYRSSLISSNYRRQAPGCRPYPQNARGFGPNYAWGGHAATYPGCLFMFGQMEGLTWPYSAVTNQVPIVSLANPVNGKSYLAGTSLTVTANATDNDGSIASVEFFLGNVSLGIDNTPPYSLVWNNIPSGSFTMKALATDYRGAAAVTSIVAFDVNAAPAVTLTAPSSGTIFTAGTNVTITATAADRDGNIAKVEFFRGNTLIGVDNAAPYSVVWNNSLVGDFDLTAVTTDNDGTSSTSAIINIHGNAAPTVSLTSPSTGTNFAAGTSVTITANANDSDGTINSVEFFHGSTSLGIDKIAPYSVVFKTIPAGSFILTAEVTDNNDISITSEKVNIIANTVTKMPPGNCTASGTILREHWANIAGSDVANIPVTTPPSYTNQMPSFQGPPTIAGLFGIGDKYGARYRGYICVPTTGKYTFWIASDDDGELWLSTDANPANRKRIAYVQDKYVYLNEWTKYANQQSALITLQAGQRYYIEALHKEGSGGDNLGVGWQLPDGTYERPIPGNRLSPFVAFVNVAPTVNLTSPDEGLNIKAGAALTLTATADDNDGTIASVEFFSGNTSLGIDTSEPYSVVWANTQAGNYALKAVATDNGGAIITSTNVAITVLGAGPSCTASGTILRESWSNVAGISIADIPVSKAPTSSSQMTSFQGPLAAQGNYGIDDNYGARYRGYICVPTTGNYTFWIASDDDGELWLSTDANPENRQLIAFIHNGYASLNEWVKYDSQQSALIALQAGQRYYIEALHKEGNGADNLAVGWQLPNGNYERPIPGNRLSPFLALANMAPIVDLTSPGEEVNVSEGTSLTLTATADDNDGSIASVEFFSGKTSLGIDTSEPYSVVWTNAQAGNYALKAVATDNDGAVGTSSNINVTVNNETCTASGTILREFWFDVTGKSVADIPLNTAPTSSSQMTSFQGPLSIPGLFGIDDNYGARYRGYICVPTTGNYTFWIISDNDGELWLSTDANPENRQRIAYLENKFVFIPDWTKYASQQSAPIALQAGQRYYIEALHKEASGGDNLAVGWQLPNGTYERPIPGNRLSPFDLGNARLDSEKETIALSGGHSKLKVFPNPFENIISLQWKDEQKHPVAITIVDSYARIRYKHEYHLDNPTRLDVDLSKLHLSKGIYYLRVQSDKGREVIRIVKR